MGFGEENIVLLVSVSCVKEDTVHCNTYNVVEVVGSHESEISLNNSVFTSIWDGLCCITFGVGNSSVYGL